MVYQVSRARLKCVIILKCSVLKFEPRLRWVLRPNLANVQTR
jgi:hypothetical protein